MNAIKKDRCGYSGYICKGLTQVIPIELYAETGTTTAPSAPSRLIQGTGKLNYNNFYNIPSIFCGSVPDIKHISGSKTACTANSYTESSCALPDAYTVISTYYSNNIMPVTVGNCAAEYDANTARYSTEYTQYLDFTDVPSSTRIFWPGFIEPIVAAPVVTLPVVDAQDPIQGLTNKVNLLERALKQVNAVLKSFSVVVDVPETVCDVKLGCINIPDINIPAPNIPKYCGMASGADLYAAVEPIYKAFNDIDFSKFIHSGTHIPDLSDFVTERQLKNYATLADLSNYLLKENYSVVTVDLTPIEAKIDEVKSDLEDLKDVIPEFVQTSVTATVKTWGKGIVTFDGKGGGSAQDTGEYGIMYRNASGIHARYGDGVVYGTDHSGSSNPGAYAPYFTIGKKGGALLMTVGNGSGADNGLVGWVNIEASSSDDGGAGILYRISESRYIYKSIGGPQTICVNKNGYVQSIDNNGGASGDSLSLMQADGTFKTIQTASC